MHNLFQVGIKLLHRSPTPGPDLWPRTLFWYPWMSVHGRDPWSGEITAKVCSNDVNQVMLSGRFREPRLKQAFWTEIQGYL